jgi:Fic family protein
MIKYSIPRQWIAYNAIQVAPALASAKAAVIALTTIPYQRSWAEKLQVIQLKREVAGTSRIEGAEFTDRELEAAVNESPNQLFTRSQRQAAAAVATYRWISGLPDDRPIDAELICEVHRRIVTGADDDHCRPGTLRCRDENVNFGYPRHRGAEGGDECKKAFDAFCKAIQSEFREHDPLIQALALHYHFAAMHPFLDGNGRTARALEALVLQRTGLRDTLFIAMSNYYYEEKNGYLAALAEVRALNNDMTPLLIFGLKGIELQCNRLLKEIQIHVRKALFRNLMYDLFKRFQSPRKRVMADRQIEILRLLLDRDDVTLEEIIKLTSHHYSSLKNTGKAVGRDLTYLIQLGAIEFEKRDNGQYHFHPRLQWPTEITETEFFNKVKALPRAKTHSFL